METDGIVNQEKTTINNSTIIDGNIKAKEHLVINGTIKGNVSIEGHNLFLGPSGKIEGEVRAHNVRVRGETEASDKAVQVIVREKIHPCVIDHH